ncbi:hypothetical protein NVP1275O_01, partial [Vibrio phage 1.275.O._10N.286.54.E11]
AFDENNQPEERKPRGKGKRTLMMDAIRAQCEGGEQEFLKRVVEMSIGDPDNDVKPNPNLIAMVLQRIEPPFKPVMPLVEFEFTEDSKPYQQASQIMKAVSEGKIAPDVAATFISSINQMIGIEQHTELKQRLEDLERLMGMGNE